MVSPKGTQYPQHGTSWLRASSLRPEDSASNIPSRNMSYARRTTSRSSESYRNPYPSQNAPRSSQARYIDQYAFEDSEYDLPEEPYTSSSFSCSRGQTTTRSRASRITDSNLPYDVEEREPSDYECFRSIGYTGDGGGSDWPTSRMLYEATSDGPQSRRNEASRSRVSRRDYDIEERSPSNYGGGMSRFSSSRGGGSRDVPDYPSPSPTYVSRSSARGSSNVSRYSGR